MTLKQKMWRAVLIGWFGGFAINVATGMIERDWKTTVLFVFVYAFVSFVGVVCWFSYASVRACDCGHTLDMHGGFWGGSGRCWGANCRCDRSIRVPEAKGGFRGKAA